jgi:small subunit ribosomal protein S12
MITINQLHKTPRIRKKRTDRKRALEQCPQKKGSCIRVYKASPKKPNSARRSVARIGLSNVKKITAYIPGEGHNLQKFSSVLIRGGRVPDLPGVKFKVVRGKYDCHTILARRNGRSLIGNKKWLKKPKIKYVKVKK